MRFLCYATARAALTARKQANELRAAASTPKLTKKHDAVWHEQDKLETFHESLVDVAVSLKRMREYAAHIEEVLADKDIQEGLYERATLEGDKHAIAFVEAIPHESLTFFAHVRRVMRRRDFNLTTVARVFDDFIRRSESAQYAGGSLEFARKLKNAMLADLQNSSDAQTVAVCEQTGAVYCTSLLTLMKQSGDAFLADFAHAYSTDAAINRLAGQAHDMEAYCSGTRYANIAKHIELYAVTHPVEGLFEFMEWLSANMPVEPDGYWFAAYCGAQSALQFFVDNKLIAPSPEGAHERNLNSFLSKASDGTQRLVYLAFAQVMACLPQPTFTTSIMFAVLGELENIYGFDVLRGTNGNFIVSEFIETMCQYMNNSYRFYSDTAQAYLRYQIPTRLRHTVGKHGAVARLATFLEQYVGRMEYCMERDMVNVFTTAILRPKEVKPTLQAWVKKCKEAYEVNFVYRYAIYCLPDGNHDLRAFGFDVKKAVQDAVKNDKFTHYAPACVKSYL